MFIHPLISKDTLDIKVDPTTPDTIGLNGYSLAQT